MAMIEQILQSLLPTILIGIISYLTKSKIQGFEDRLKASEERGIQHDVKSAKLEEKISHIESTLTKMDMKLDKISDNLGNK